MLGIDWVGVTPENGRKLLLSLLFIADTNRPDLMLETVESLDDQLYPNWDLFIACPHGLPALVRRTLQAAAARVPGITLVDAAPDAAAGDQWRTALARTEAPFVGFLEGGDRLAATALYEVALALAGCKQEDMYTQHRSQTWDRNTFFANQSSMRVPVAGTVARDAPDPPAPMPAAIDAAMLQRGENRYEIFCTGCHGRAGNGNGMITLRGFPRSPSLVEGPLREAKADVFWNSITNGYGVMYSFADRIAPADRWAVIAYIRALQESQNSPVDALPAEDRAQLQALK